MELPGGFLPSRILSSQVYGCCGRRRWKSCLLLLENNVITQSNGHTKYAWEALCFQLQLVTLPHPVAHQLKWGRFVNTHGGPGRNISCDLYNKHMNKLFKDFVHNLIANLT